MIGCRTSTPTLLLARHDDAGAWRVAARAETATPVCSVDLAAVPAAVVAELVACETDQDAIALAEVRRDVYGELAPRVRRDRRALASRQLLRERRAAAGRRLLRPQRRVRDRPPHGRPLEGWSPTPRRASSAPSRGARAIPERPAQRLHQSPAATGLPRLHRQEIPDGRAESPPARLRHQRSRPAGRRRHAAGEAALDQLGRREGARPRLPAPPSRQYGDERPRPVTVVAYELMPYCGTSSPTTRACGSSLRASRRSCGSATCRRGGSPTAPPRGSSTSSRRRPARAEPARRTPAVSDSVTSTLAGLGRG